MKRVRGPRRSLASRLLLGLVATLVLLGGLALLTGTEAGRVMAGDLLGVAIWLLLAAAGIAALLRHLGARSNAQPEPESDTEWADRLRHSPSYELLPGNYWFSGLKSRDPMDDR